MCGLAGFLLAAPQEARHSLTDTLAKMAKRLAHRGPDDEGVWLDENAGIGLAHRRLAIVDVSPQGHQPMVSPAGRYIMVYNGEVYNAAQLRHELKDYGVTWRGHSDTETMLAAIEAWGLHAAVRRFVGMFAFVLWDRETRTLHLCRDRVGVKPLYYGIRHNTLVFGSELKSLRVWPNFAPRVDHTALTRYLQRGFVPAPLSIYTGIFKLPPGSISSVAANILDRALPDPVTYWSAHSAAETGIATIYSPNDPGALRDVEALLLDAVRMRMVADVPLGAFLSGGIDSSLVTALMQRESNRPVKTFSIGFAATGYDEAHHAAAVARHLGTDHHELYVDGTAALNVVPQLATIYDEPLAAPSQIPLYLLAHMTRQHVTVALSGDGGDELFGGYTRYLRAERLGKTVNNVPLHMRRFLAAAIRRISPLRWDALYGALLPVLPRRLHHTQTGLKAYKLAQWLETADSRDVYSALVSHWPAGHGLVTAANLASVDTIVAPPFNDPAGQMMFNDFVS